MQRHPCFAVDFFGCGRGKARARDSRPVPQPREMGGRKAHQFFERPREMKGVGEAQFIGHLLDGRPRAQEQFRTSRHLQSQEELVRTLVIEAAK